MAPVRVMTDGTEQPVATTRRAVQISVSFARDPWRLTVFAVFQGPTGPPRVFVSVLGCGPAVSVVPTRTTAIIDVLGVTDLGISTARHALRMRLGILKAPVSATGIGVGTSAGSGRVRVCPTADDVWDQRRQTVWSAMEIRSVIQTALALLDGQGRNARTMLAHAGQPVDAATALLPRNASTVSPTPTATLSASASATHQTGPRRLTAQSTREAATDFVIPALAH
jgi:hypothetical protein